MVFVQIWQSQQWPGARDMLLYWSWNCGLTFKYPGCEPGPLRKLVCEQPLCLFKKKKKKSLLVIIIQAATDCLLSSFLCSHIAHRKLQRNRKLLGSIPEVRKSLLCVSLHIFRYGWWFLSCSNIILNQYWWFKLWLQDIYFFNCAQCAITYCQYVLRLIYPKTCCTLSHTETLAEMKRGKEVE